MSALTLPLAKDHLNLTSTDTDRDEELQGVIDAAEAAVVARVGPLVPLPVVSRVTSDASGRFWLPRLPVESLISVTAGRGSVVALDTLTLTSDGSGAVDGAAPGCAFEVTYMVGVSADLWMAVKEMLSHLWEPQRGAGRGAGRRSQDDDGPSTPSYFMPHRVAEMLAPHRWRRGFGIA